MPDFDYKPLYFHLFNSITDAAELLRGDERLANIPAAQRVAGLLREAQRRAEEMYINSTPDLKRPDR